MFCLHTHLHPPLLKRTPDITEVHFVVTSFIICQHEFRFQLQMALEIKYTMLMPFALALKFTLYFLTCH